MADHHSKDGKHEEGAHAHHILSNSMAFRIWGILIGLTFITVAVAQIDLGPLNFAVAMLVASIKASLVCMFFMGLKYDHKENTVIFTTAFIFMSIFMILTFGDLLTRGDVYVKGSILPASAMNQKSKLVKPWIATPELVAHGKEQFMSQCITCHGPEGLGNGPASGSLNPKPRNFTSDQNWKNGRKPSQIFSTITKGLGGMPSFASAPSDDRWSLVAYVRTLGPHQNEKDTDEDLKKIGIDPSKDDGGGGGEKVLPVGFAIDQMVEEGAVVPQDVEAKGKQKK